MLSAGLGATLGTGRSIHRVPRCENGNNSKGLQLSRLELSMQSKPLLFCNLINVVVIQLELLL
jgi:hypothetical protein